MKKTRIVLVDADACPNQIKKAILEISNFYEYKVFFIASYSHATDQYRNAEWILVDAEPESVDMYIVNQSIKGNVVITQDHGLASLLVSKGVYVISPRGKHYSEEEMPSLLQSRYYSSKLRRSGHRTKGPPPFTEEDAERFSNSFNQLFSDIGE
ncbi:YaiI/YqxD family protein [Pseudalkalibacillus berkeleyi]|uniref:UPF0178 protein L2716_09490 n=1 Tax=Pseudalkalibacillus berkeleyi TaxID=1069813 RepID=A0ABS9H211_9BACL|nr:DUF188 domain-containing protein [Pseudalkalibacillus berkeleyi]MCF6137954.1 DUF188 domain-containing protein [Pseudalkalibacillus berkeleyi]